MLRSPLQAFEGILGMVHRWVSGQCSLHLVLHLLDLRRGRPHRCRRRVQACCRRRRQPVLYLRDAALELLHPPPDVHGSEVRDPLQLGQAGLDRAPEVVDVLLLHVLIYEECGREVSAVAKPQEEPLATPGSAHGLRAHGQGLQHDQRDRQAEGAADGVQRHHEQRHRRGLEQQEAGNPGAEDELCVLRVLLVEGGHGLAFILAEARPPQNSSSLAEEPAGPQLQGLEAAHGGPSPRPQLRDAPRPSRAQQRLHAEEGPVLPKVKVRLLQRLLILGLEHRDRDVQKADCKEERGEAGKEPLDCVPTWGGIISVLPLHEVEAVAVRQEEAAVDLTQELRPRQILVHHEEGKGEGEEEADHDYQYGP
mmetsp:Transcript_114268/g.334093  ORF Transcript_114268/g.334093 Transcript_114268/m.334093 type:complete len:365 (-) Transcript_114268:2542-3636(-)